MSIGNSRFAVIFTVFFSPGVPVAQAHFPNMADGVTAHKSTGGGGYGRPDSAGVSPTSTRKNKKPPLLLKKSRKRKKTSKRKS
nr:MAG TPA: hypothetical protein [Bacteriophage sp.]